MLELVHAVIASLLLSAGLGVGVDAQAEAEGEPTNSETGVDVGTMPSHLALRGHTPGADDDFGDDDLPKALSTHHSFTEPTVCVALVILPLHDLPQAVAFPTAGRSP
jgi:hypothetical protein